MKPFTMLNSICYAFVAMAIFVCLPAMARENTQKKPNVVFILADNVAYGDMGPYGGGELRGAPTPNIDRLAHEGLRKLSTDLRHLVPEFKQHPPARMGRDQTRHGGSDLSSLVD